MILVTFMHRFKLLQYLYILDLQLLQAKPVLAFLLRPTAKKPLTTRILLALLKPKFAERRSNLRMKENDVYTKFIRYVREVAGMYQFPFFAASHLFIYLIMHDKLKLATVFSEKELAISVTMICLLNFNQTNHNIIGYYLHQIKMQVLSAEVHG